MKVNGNKRKIFDAVDLLMDEMTPETNGDGIQLLPVDEIKPFPDHPFHLYEGERLQDMVESVREHGVLNPVIVRKIPEGYEMLSGHNRMNAAKIAGMKEIPAIVKEELSDKEAYVYVIETNVMQRSFSDLLPSEKAAVLAERYEKVMSQGKRNDILNEIAILEGKKSTSGQFDQKLGNRDALGKEYGLSGSSVARFLRINFLINEFKNEVDKGNLKMYIAVPLSFLSTEEQQMIYEVVQELHMKLNSDHLDALRKAAGKLTSDRVRECINAVNETKISKLVVHKVPRNLTEKYFKNMNTEQIDEILEQALDAWFKERRECN